MRIVGYEWHKRRKYENKSIKNQKNYDRDTMYGNQGIGDDNVQRKHDFNDKSMILMEFLKISHKCEN